MTVDQFIASSPEFTLTKIGNFHHDYKLCYNGIIAFDIEASTIEGESQMYIWQMTIDGQLVMGRYWEEWKKLMGYIAQRLGPEVKWYCFIHNLPYEWTYIDSVINKKAVHDGLTKNDELIKVMANNCEFRCSYALSGLGLRKWAEQMGCPIQKLEMDYTTPRNSETLLTEEELDYCANDVLVMDWCLRKLLELYGTHNKIESLPYTRTGLTRINFNRKIKSLPKEQQIQLLSWLSNFNFDNFGLKQCALKGGDIHVQSWNIGEKLSTVYSYDICSSYAYQLLTCEYPTGKEAKIENPCASDIVKLIDKQKLFIAKLKLRNVEFRENAVNPMLFNLKCKTKGEVEIADGRIYKAEEVDTIFTSTDLITLAYNYKYEIDKVEELIYYQHKSLLPQAIRTVILQQYKEKTELKGVEGKEAEYLSAKTDYNIMCFGLHAKSPLYGLKSEETIAERASLYYRKEKNKFLNFDIAVWTTAFARRDLNSKLELLDNDVISWDTDRITFFGEENRELFINSNQERKSKLIELGYAEKDIEVLGHMIGEWEEESKFAGGANYKAFGNKVYAVYNPTQDRNYLIASGLKMNDNIYNYLLELSDGDFTNLEFGTEIPADLAPTARSFKTETGTIIQPLPYSLGSLNVFNIYKIMEVK